MSTTVKLNRIPQWQHLSRIKHCPPISDSSITAKDEYSCIPLGPMQLCFSHKLSLFLSYITSQSSSGSQFSAIGELTNNWPCLQMKPGKKPSASAPGDLRNFQISAKPALTMPPLCMKHLDRSVPIIPTKGWNVRSLAFLGWAEGPKASTLKPDPLIYDHLIFPASLFLSLQNNSGTSSYSTSQACRPVPSGDHR
jgi:hypothetical protein